MMEDQEQRNADSKIDEQESEDRRNKSNATPIARLNLDEQALEDRRNKSNATPIARLMNKTQRTGGARLREQHNDDGIRCCYKSILRKGEGGTRDVEIMMPDA
jgi:hypothetical protein